ncbi:unnamed protein product [Tenebrio molitor]|nr:unnamed protein product [Tenebrio molitor]
MTNAGGWHHRAGHIGVRFTNRDRKKKDGRPRFCVDYRRLNEVTKDEAAPLPIIHETLRDLGQVKVFTSLDLKSGYWQVPLVFDHPHFLCTKLVL